jgi:hypothetical protein
MSRKPTYADETFERWYFDGAGVLCSPEGDRFNPWMIRACHFQKALKEFSNLLHWRPQQPTRDVVMSELMDLLDQVEDQQKAIASARTGKLRESGLLPRAVTAARPVAAVPGFQEIQEALWLRQ